MARVNIGVHPRYLADQHLIAESVEITMITGGFKKNKFILKSPIPKEFALGTGHINFFKNKLLYLKNRLDLVNNEMIYRGFNPGTHLDLSEFPSQFVNDWSPSEKDSNIIRERIISRLITRSRGQKGLGYYRYFREIMNEAEFFKLIDTIKTSQINNI